MEKMRHLRIEYCHLARGSRTLQYYFEELSMIRDERRYQVIDVSTQQSVGILGEEFMMTKARLGLHFIVKGKVWQIEQISDDARVYVTPVEDPTAAVQAGTARCCPSHSISLNMWVDFAQKLQKNWDQATCQRS